MKYFAKNDRYDAEIFLSFLKDILDKYPGQRLVVILDNAKIHHAKLLQPFLDANNHVFKLVFLPPYSPNLNLIEEFWGWIKRSCIYNVFYHSIDEMSRRIQNFISIINQTPQKTIDRLCCSL